MTVTKALVFPLRLEEAEVSSSGSLFVEGTALMQLFIRLRYELSFQERSLVNVLVVLDIVRFIDRGLLLITTSLHTLSILFRALASACSSSHMRTLGQVNLF